MNSELARPVKTELANINVGQLLESIVRNGVTGDAAAAVKELVLLQEHQQDRAARQSYVEAFSRVRARTKKINATHANPTKSGEVRWWMAKLEELQEEIEPICMEEGLDFNFNSRRDPSAPNIVIGQCIIRHIATGHTEVFECGYNSANAQGGDLGALTSAKRGAMIAAFALRIGHTDGDSRMLGDMVNPEMAKELRERLMATGRSDRKFLAMAGVNVPDNVPVSLEDWKRIRQGKLGILHDALRKAEAASNTQQQTPPVGQPHTTPPNAVTTGQGEAAGGGGAESSDLQADAGESSAGTEEQAIQDRELAESLEGDWTHHGKRLSREFVALKDGRTPAEYSKLQMAALTIAPNNSSVQQRVAFVKSLATARAR